jgi:hypothetical protein
MSQTRPIIVLKQTGGHSPPLSGSWRWKVLPKCSREIVAVSLHGRRYFFPYGKATDAGAPFTRETLVEIGSCTKTFTTTLFALAINRNQIVADASAMDRFITPAAFIARALCSSIFAAAIPSPKARQW